MDDEKGLRRYPIALKSDLCRIFVVGGILCREMKILKFPEKKLNNNKNSTAHPVIEISVVHLASDSDEWASCE